MVFADVPSCWCMETSDQSSVYIGSAVSVDTVDSSRLTVDHMVSTSVSSDESEYIGRYLNDKACEICILTRNSSIPALNIVPFGEETGVFSPVLHRLISHLSPCSVVADTFTNALNFSILVGIVICPVTGFVLGFRASRSKWSDRRRHGYLRYPMRM